MDKDIVDFYSQDGGDLPFFVGKQYGSGWLRTLARFAFPVVKRIAKHAGNVIANTTEDLIEGKKSFGESLRTNATNELGSAVTSLGRGMPINSPAKRKTPTINTNDTIFAKKKRRR